MGRPRVNVDPVSVRPEPSARWLDAPPSPTQVHFTIDDTPVSVAAGTTILQAARDHGIPIPVLCYQANERPLGVCRMCSVDSGEETLVAACVKPAADGMVVRTNSPKAKQARRMLLELLLADHPSPCARQQRSADCELETLAIAEGILESRFRSRPSSRGQDESSALLSVNHDACIPCDRCVRACNEVRHNNVLGRAGKGYEARIAFDLNDPAGRSSCISCGECLVSCPTGALTNKTMVATALPAGEPTEVRFLKQLPYFGEISGTFLELNKNAVVLRRFRAGEIICRQGEYGSTAFFILEGPANAFLEMPYGGHEKEPTQPGLWQRFAGFFTRSGGDSPQRSSIPIDASIDLPMNGRAAELGPGDLFGEMSCINHYPRSATVQAITDCVVLEMLRNVLDMMLQRNPGMRALLDSNYRSRTLKAHLRATKLFAAVSEDFLAGIAERALFRRVHKGDVICRQGTKADSLSLVRTGFVKVIEERAEGELVLAYLGRGGYFGEAGLLDGGACTTTVVALETTDLVQVWDHDFEEMVRRFPGVCRGFANVAESIREENKRQLLRSASRTKIDIPLENFLRQGLMEANSVLLLDLEKCTRCDACVRACADAHDGVTRLVREGLRFDKYLVATSCRQCRDPLCMVGCPVGAIRRRGSLEVVIEDWCIGCGLCAENCPYGSINMHPVAVPEGNRAEPGKHLVAMRKATSCDLCTGLAEPSCVYACPHDAAHRVDASRFFRGMAAGGGPAPTGI
jgi:CRP-like cAMP-binding protein/Fe-S-cluster-containing dehydrogenase component